MQSIFQKYKGSEQVILWLFFFLFIFDYQFLEGNWREAFLYTSLEIASYLFLFYINYLVLIPLFLKKEKRLLYGLSLLLLFVLYIGFIHLSGLEEQLYEGSSLRNTFSMMLNISLFLLLSTLYWSYQQLHREKERKLQLQTEKLAAELKFLKTQISPHFIFNTLNNIYALTLQKHDNAAPMVSRLSKMMRYVLYDCSENKVFVEKEVEALEDYIQLQLLRLPASDNVDFYVEGPFAGLKIAPLLLINLVENCFKHGDLNENETAWIRMECLLEEDTLHFVSENSFQIHKITTNKEKKVGGIGLENIKRQLELNYPEKHELSIQTLENVYKVDLKIELER